MQKTIYGLLVCAACWLGAFANVANAAETAVIVDDSKAGTYLLTVNVDGSVTVNPIKVVRPGQSPNPPTNPKPVPTAFALEVRDMTNKVLSAGGTKTTAAAFSSVWELLAEGLDDGSVDPTKVFDYNENGVVKDGALKKSSTIIFTMQPDGPKWDEFRKELAKALNDLRNAEQLNTKDQMVVKFREIAVGMNLASGFEGNPRQLAEAGPNAGILDFIDPEQIRRLIELIKLILDLFKQFKPV
jgi:hypothetical protein